MINKFDCYWYLDGTHDDWPMTIEADGMDIKSITIPVQYENGESEVLRFVPERTCKVVKETVDIDGERMTDYSCGCCNQSGWNHNYCPNCGRKVVDE